MLKIDFDADDWKGQWALVTGASSGIGREFAQQLASRKINLVLVARRKALLDDLAEELARRHGIAHMTVAEDLSEPGAPNRIRHQTEQAGIRIRLLVNNAAFGRWGRFEATTAATYQDMLQLDAIAPVTLCREFLDQLSSFTNAAVVNISSPAAFQPIPYMAVYAAAKAFVQQFSQALHGEWAQRGILVQTLLPGPTATEFDQIAGAYGSAIDERGDPGSVVTASLRGLHTGKPVVSSTKGTLKQRLFALMPARLVLHVVGGMFKPPKT